MQGGIAEVAADIAHAGDAGGCWGMRCCRS